MGGGMDDEIYVAFLRRHGKGFFNAKAVQAVFIWSPTKPVQCAKPFLQSSQPDIYCVYSTPFLQKYAY